MQKRQHNAVFPKHDQVGQTSLCSTLHTNWST